MFHQFGHHSCHCHNSKFVGMLCVTVVLANLRRSEPVDRNGSICSFYAMSGCKVHFLSWSNEQLFFLFGFFFLTKFCHFGVSSFAVFGFKTSGCSWRWYANGKNLKFRSFSRKSFRLESSFQNLRQIHVRSTKS